MKKVIQQPIKIIDNFFENPWLWRYNALKQNYIRSLDPTVPGYISEYTLSEINHALFDTLAAKLITHVVNSKGFKNLQVRFSYGTSDIKKSWILKNDPIFPVCGCVFLTENRSNNYGLCFNTEVEPFDPSIYINKELEGDTATEIQQAKVEQEKRFIKTVKIHHVFNRCVIFSNNDYLESLDYFGSTVGDSRLIIMFKGIPS